MAARLFVVRNFDCKGIAIWIAIKKIIIIAALVWTYDPFNVEVFMQNSSYVYSF